MLSTGAGIGRPSGQRRLLQQRRDCPIQPPPAFVAARAESLALPRLLPGVVTRARPCSGLSPAVTTLSAKPPPHQLSAPREEKRRPWTQRQPQRLSRSDSAALEALKAAADKPRRAFVSRSSTVDECTLTHLQRQLAPAFAGGGGHESGNDRGALFRQPSALRRPPSSVAPAPRPPSAVRPRALPPLAAAAAAATTRDGGDTETGEKGEEEEEERSNEESESGCSTDESEVSLRLCWQYITALDSNTLKYESDIKHNFVFRISLFLSSPPTADCRRSIGCPAQQTGV